MMIKEKYVIYAVRDIDTGRLLNKRRGNPFFISKSQAESLLEYYREPHWSKVYNVEVVAFTLEEVDDET